jgi:hypothetical protein
MYREGKAEFAVNSKKTEVVMQEQNNLLPFTSTSVRLGGDF